MGTKKGKHKEDITENALVINTKPKIFNTILLRVQPIDVFNKFHYDYYM